MLTPMTPEEIAKIPIEARIEVDVNFEFTEMLRRLEDKGVFGTEQTCLPCYQAIAQELAMRLFTFGQSCGATLEAAKK